MQGSTCRYQVHPALPSERGISAAYAVGLPLPHIMCLSNHTSTSVVHHHYLDAIVYPCSSERLLFGRFASLPQSPPGLRSRRSGKRAEPRITSRYRMIALVILNRRTATPRRTHVRHQTISHFSDRRRRTVAITVSQPFLLPSSYSLSARAPAPSQACLYPLFSTRRVGKGERRNESFGVAALSS